MKSPPRKSVQPALSQAAVAGSVPGANGLKAAVATSPVTSGTMPMMSSGKSTATPTIACTRAVDRIPRCWMAKEIRIRIAPMKKAELMRSVRPSLRKPRSAMVICQVRIAASGGTMRSGCSRPRCRTR